ncbi:MAG TPA: xanthine dehydrogenase family protein subunit M [Chloroflexota bacterium]|nr:xanthine dehydrogenase family protein subunit M [Chloroflexota bacterium]
MYPASFTYVAPRSLEEALDLLTRLSGEAKLLAGGHSLIPAMKLRLSEPGSLIDLGRVPELAGVRVDGETLVIGALTVHADLAESPLVRQHLPGLADAASLIGDVQVRNRGTIGGSAAHADPGADEPVILTALDATFALASANGRRFVQADEFFTGFFTTALAPNEILTEVRIPIPPRNVATAYAKLGHPASGYVLVSAGALVRRAPNGAFESARIALGGLGGGPTRARGVEEALQGAPVTPDAIAAAASRAAEGTDPDDDPYASAEYKRHLATVLARRAIESAVARLPA